MRMKIREIKEKVEVTPDYNFDPDKRINPSQTTSVSTSFDPDKRIPSCMDIKPDGDITLDEAEDFINGLFDPDKRI